MIQRLLMLLVIAYNVQIGQRCIIHPRVHFGEPMPVIIRNGQLLEPTDKSGNLEMVYGETLTLSCEGAGFILHPQATREVITATVTCEGGENFKNEEWLQIPAEFSQFRCHEAPNYSSRSTERRCYDNNRIIEVGYSIENEFYPVYESCFNDATFNPIYSKYTQKPYNAKFQTRVARPYFIAGRNYGFIPVEMLYSPRGLKDAVAQHVGPMIDTYFTKAQFLNRGHLAAKTDFVYDFGERATFHYVNCAPQWAGFNGGNWNTLEVDLREHVHSAELNTVIYTGTYGVTQLSNQFGQMVDIFLYSDENNNPVIPVPLYFYKVVYEPGTLRGIAFVGINNPYYTPQEAKRLVFCDDVCRGDSRFSWLTWHPDNPAEGYTFCCKISEFRHTVRHLPQFEVYDLLT